MVMFDWLFGSPKEVHSSNPQSMHYKHVPFEDRAILQSNIVQWVCDKGHSNFESSGKVTGRCYVCSALSSGVRNKPHYKWSWKLNKAVRL